MKLSGHSLEPVSGDAFRSVCDHIFWCNDQPHEDARFRHGDVVFCKVDEVWRLFRALRRTRKRIVLVTGEGDQPVDEALWRSRPPHVSAWFGTNMQIRKNHAAFGLPLGLGNAGAVKTLTWREMNDVAIAAPTRQGLLYANFSAHSNPSVRGPLLEWLSAPEQTWIEREAHSAKAARASYRAALFSHHFVLCPPGNGEDTHRFWEALYCGATPIIRRSFAMSHFADLPCIVVEDFADLTRTLLESLLPRSAHDNHPSLWLGHWRNRLVEAGSRARQQGVLSWREWSAAWKNEFAAACR